MARIQDRRNCYLGRLVQSAHAQLLPDHILRAPNNIRLINCNTLDSQVVNNSNSTVPMTNYLLRHLESIGNPAASRLVTSS